MEIKTINLTLQQARTFILKLHGLIGEHKFIGKEGILEFIKQVGCIQFDPIDVCGKNAELVLQSRIKDFSKNMLDKLLYKDRLLFDFFDKNLSIMDINDWKYFENTRNRHKEYGKSKNEIDAITDLIQKTIHEKGYVCSNDLDNKESVDWYWSKTTLARATLETLYFRGILGIHHKKGSIKYYSFADSLFPFDIINQENPLKNEFEIKKWFVLRRIKAVGLLWNKASDAYLGVSCWAGIGTLKSDERNTIFSQLINEQQIIPIKIEGITPLLYTHIGNIDLINEILTDKIYTPRMELLAPLDNFLWDRKLIKTLFGFDYTWEIYTPQDKRKYGYYVLPLIYGNSFIGRAEIIFNKKEKKLKSHKIWLENGVRINHRKWHECLKRFAKFNHCIIEKDC